MTSEGTYETPVPMPGAVSLSLEQQGELSPFYADGIKYYVNYGDAWYFFGYDLEVTLNHETNEPQYNYIKQED